MFDFGRVNEGSDPLWARGARAGFAPQVWFRGLNAYSWNRWLKP